MNEGGEASYNSESELVFDFFCELCIDDNKRVEAEGYCVDCREYLCGYCYNGHRKSRPTRNHVLQDKSNMPKDTPLSTDRVSKYVTTKCKIHSCNHVEYYCESHAVLGCANCFATDHKHCDDIESVARKSENILESQWYNEFLSNLQLIQNKSRDIAAQARKYKTVSQRCCADVVSMVRKLKEETIVMLNEFEQNTVTLAEKMMSEDGEKSQSVVEDCKILTDKIEQFSSEFETLQSSKRVCQIYINMREKEGEVKTLNEHLGRLEEANVERTFRFEPNSGLTSLLRSSDILGIISQQRQQVRIPRPVSTRDPRSITAKRLADIRVRTSSDSSNCWITGSAVVSHNRLIITDANNNKVKLVDTHTNKLLSELEVSSQPWDIAMVNGTKAAVTLQYNNKILMMKVSPSLTWDEEIPVRGKCRGIAYSQDRLLVTFVDKPHLEIIDLCGNGIKTIQTGRGGPKLFQYPGHVCVSRNGETVYVSDRDRGTVTSLTCDGVVKALYKDEEMKGPYKVCTDDHGNVYVCGFWSKNVHMITADCKKIKVILTQADGLDTNVRSVSHCRETNRLFIGMIEDVVKVYQLS